MFFSSEIQKVQGFLTLHTSFYLGKTKKRLICMNLSELKNLVVSAKTELNSLLFLKRSKRLKFEDREYFDLLTFLSCWNVAAEGGSEIMNELDCVPSGDALMQQLQKFKIFEVEEMFNAVFEKQFRKQVNKKKKAVVIVDIHEQETYSKEKRVSDDIRGGKHKNGTNFFFKFATIQVIVKDKILTLGVKIFRRQNTLYRIVNDLVKRAKDFVKIKVLLLDRGFRDVKIFNQLEYLQVPVLMPCIKDNKTRKEFEKAVTNYQVINSWWKNGKGEYADFKLLIIKLSNGKEIGFCTTIRFTWLHNAKYYLNIYAKRWNIETGYRLQKQFLPKTTCIKGVVRYFYFCYAVAMHNLWQNIRNIVGKKFVTVAKIKFTLIYFWITTHLNFNI